MEKLDLILVNFTYSQNFHFARQHLCRLRPKTAEGYPPKCQRFPKLAALFQALTLLQLPLPEVEADHREQC
jgi:hypothetical protein|tara:strand:- start:576 stop:788 length:213 start_codon:yes stop_codon:yes gene_type:complete